MCIDLRRNRWVRLQQGHRGWCRRERLQCWLQQRHHPRQRPRARGRRRAGLGRVPPPRWKIRPPPHPPRPLHPESCNYHQYSHMHCVQKDLPDGSDSVGDGSISLHLLRGNEVPGDQHSKIVPDLHHLLVRSSTESESMVTSAEQTSTGGLAVSRGTVLSGLDVELVRLGSSSRRRRTKGAGR